MNASKKTYTSDSDECIYTLLVTANVGSLFEDPLRLLRPWLVVFLQKVEELHPKFLALHLQEVGGKTYEKSMECVQEFIKQLCEAPEMHEYELIRIFMDEDFNSAEHFTALGNLYFIHKNLKSVRFWNFLTRTWEKAEGKDIYSGNIETIATKEKSKFPQHFFPECKWSRKGFMRTRWEVNNTVFDLVNIHLFHDASNLAACEEFPSIYCRTRRRALVHTLERFHLDEKNGLVPFFVFGDFNFRCDAEGVVKVYVKLLVYAEQEPQTGIGDKKNTENCQPTDNYDSGSKYPCGREELTENLTAHRVQSSKSDNTKVHYRNSAGDNVLTVGKKEFNHADHQLKFKESWLKKFDRELEPLRDFLHEFLIDFPPSYPYEEDPEMPTDYMSTRCPSWCDRILMSPQAKLILDENISPNMYNLIGENVCMGDHKPVYLYICIKPNQGTYRCCNCHYLKAKSTHNIPAITTDTCEFTDGDCVDNGYCPHKNENYNELIFECKQINNELNDSCTKSAVRPSTLSTEVVPNLSGSLHDVRSNIGQTTKNNNTTQFGFICDKGSHSYMAQTPPEKLQMIINDAVEDDVVWREQCQTDVSALSNLSISCKTRYVQIHPLGTNANIVPSSNLTHDDAEISNLDAADDGFLETLNNVQMLTILKETTV